MKIPDNCLFYQTIDLPGVGLVEGSWDHRSATDVFLGHVDFRGKRALDVGPANGFFSFEMEKRGAVVTAVDLGQKSDWDIVPHPFTDTSELKAIVRSNVQRVENAFWFGHKALGSKVKLVHGAVYDVPDIITEVDIALMSNVLQHFRDPFRAIQRVSEAVKETLIITETLWYDDPAFIDSASLRLIPRAESPEVNHSWWQVTPTFVMELAKLLGFPDIRCEIHHQKFNGVASDLTVRMVKHFTVTARRPRLLPQEDLRQFQVQFGPVFHPAERNAKHEWRWASQTRANINITNRSDTPTTAGLTFGLVSSIAGATVRIVINDHAIWEGKDYYGIRPVFLPSILLAPGDNTISIYSSQEPPPPTASDPKSRSFAIYDFALTHPSATA